MKKRTKYQLFQLAASNFCKTGSPAAKERLKKAEERYKKDAKEKGKTATEIGKTVSRVKKCPTGIGKAKKRKTTKRKKRK